MTKSKQNMVFGIGRMLLILVFLGASYQEFYVNRMSGYWETKAEQDAVSVQLLTRMRMNTQVETFQQRERSYCDSLEKELNGRIPETADKDRIHTIINETASRSEITILSIDVNDEETAFEKTTSLAGNLSSQAKSFRRIPISVEASGRTHNIAHFMSLLLESDRLLTLERADVVRSEADFPHVAANLDLYAYYHKK